MLLRVHGPPNPALCLSTRTLLKNEHAAADVVCDAFQPPSETRLAPWSEPLARLFCVYAQGCLEPGASIGLGSQFGWCFRTGGINVSHPNRALTPIEFVLVACIG